MNAPPPSAAASRPQCKGWKLATLVASGLLAASVVWQVNAYLECTPALKLMDDPAEMPRTAYATGAIFAALTAPGDLPEGWLACDGAILQEREHRRLFRLIGRTYSAPTDPAGTFRLPDYRGMYLIGPGRHFVSYGANLDDPVNPDPGELPASWSTRQIRWFVCTR